MGIYTYLKAKCFLIKVNWMSQKVEWFLDKLSWDSHVITTPNHLNLIIYFISPYSGSLWQKTKNTACESLFVLLWSPWLLQIEKFILVSHRLCCKSALTLCKIHVVVSWAWDQIMSLFSCKVCDLEYIIYSLKVMDIQWCKNNFCEN